jgi:transcription antitermination factor NusG
MSANMDTLNDFTAGLTGVGDAVGVNNKKWFVAIVNHNCEKSSSEKLDKLCIENYIPTQTVLRIWKNGRKSKVVKVEIPSIVFIRCTEHERREIVTLPFIYRFMTDRANKATNYSKSLAIVSDDEIKRLKFMLGQSDIPIEITDRPYQTGDKVKVIRGSLAGLDGEVIEMNPSKSVLTVSLKYFGCAKLVIDTINLELIKN